MLYAYALQLIMPFNLLLFFIVGLGGIIPYFMRMKSLPDTKNLHIIALSVILVSATIADVLNVIVYHQDVGVMFTRAFLVDGFGLYFLNYPPARGR
jgi:uncharacterized membrane protein